MRNKQITYINREIQPWNAERSILNHIKLLLRLLTPVHIISAEYTFDLEVGFLNLVFCIDIIVNKITQN